MPDHPTKLLLDENIGVIVEEELREDGIDVLSILKVMPGASDREVIDRARREKRIIVTLDKDFGYLAHRVGVKHAGVLFLRLRKESPANIVRVLRSCMLHLPKIRGRFAKATEHKMTLH